MTDTATQDQTFTAAAQMSDGSNAGKEMTVSNGASPTAGPMTEAQQKKAKLERVMSELAARAEGFAPLLNAHNIPWEVFTAIIQQSIIKVPFILKCTTASILQACMRAAADGLFPDGDECALVPFKNTQQNVYEATYVPGYKGMLKCAYAMQDGTGAKVYRDVDLDVVYEGEEGLFKYRKGTDPFLEFSPPLNRNTDAKVVGAYAVVRTNNGGVFVEVVPEKELAKIAAVNKATSGPRSKWAAEMHKKGPLRRLMKRTPKDQRLARLMRHDEDAYLPNAAGVVDGDESEIPQDKLFDDTAHHTADGDVRDAQIDDAGVQGAEVADGVAPEMVKARADLLACDSVEKLDRVIAEIVAWTKAPRKRKWSFTEEQGAQLLADAEKLRDARFGAQPEDCDHPADQRTVNADNEVVCAACGEIFEDDEEAGSHISGDPVDDLPQDSGDKAEGDRPQPQGSTAIGSSESTGEPKPTTTTTSSTDTSSTAPGSTSETQTRALTPEERQAAVAELQKTQSGGPGVDTVITPRGYQPAPPERRLTPQEALLADESDGIHFKVGLKPDAAGKVPMFNALDEIVGWAKPDLDIPTREGALVQPEAAPQPDPKKEPEPQPEPAATQAQAQSNIRDNPEDRQDPAQVQGGDDDGYGEPAPPAAHDGVVYRMKVHHQKPPKEYADPVEWRDAMLFKMSVLSAVAVPKWWGDNEPFVIAALATAKPQAGRIIVTAVAKKLPGAAELVTQHGPF